MTMSGGGGRFDDDFTRSRSTGNDPTRIVNQSSNYEPTHVLTDRLARPGGEPARDSGATQILPMTPGGQPGESAFDPVVGWLVVMVGPGKGQSCVVRYGQNSMGRGSDMRIQLDFGDQRITREAHAIIVYDDRSRRFFVRDTGKTNLVRVGDNTVLAPVEIKDRDLISLGDTTLMFVALCNPTFDWLAGNDNKSA